MHFRICIEFMCSRIRESEEWVKGNSSITLVSRLHKVDIAGRLKVFTHDVNNPWEKLLRMLVELTGGKQ